MFGCASPPNVLHYIREAAVEGPFTRGWGVRAFCLMTLGCPMRWVVLVSLLGLACLDITVTAQGPCRSFVVRDSASDTLYVAVVDSTLCPKR